MFDNSWYDKALDTIYTKVSTRVTKEMKSKYPNIRFTTSDKNDATVYPTVAFMRLTGNEVGADLVGETINGVESNLQIKVYYNKNQEGANEVMWSVINNMKKLGYQTTMPIFENEATVYCSTCRMSRVIGSGDKF